MPVVPLPFDFRVDPGVQPGDFKVQRRHHGHVAFHRAYHDPRPSRVLGVFAANVVEGIVQGNDVVAVRIHHFDFRDIGFLFTDI